MESAPRPHYQLTFGILALGIGAFSLLQSLVIPLLSTVQAELHTSQSAVTWVLTAYLLSASVMTPILGRVGDIYGKKWVFVAALAGLAVGSVLAAVAPNLAVLIVARVIQGLGGGSLPLGFGIIRDEFPADRVAGAVGILAALTAVGGSLGIVLAGPIVNALNWHWLFWLPGIATMIAAVGAVLFIPQSPIRSPGTISWLPAVLLSGWLVALLVPLSEAPSWGWGAPAVIGLLAVAVLLAAAWVWSELRAATPLIDMKMMRRPGVWTNNLVALLIGVGMYAMFAFLPEFVQTPSSAGYGFGASISRSGLMLLPSGVTMFAVGLFVGTLTRRLGGKVLVVAGCIVGCAAMAMFAFAHSQEWEIYVATGVIGVGFGLAFSAMTANVVSAVPAGQTSVATGMNANIRTIGGSIGAAVMASIVTAKLEPSGLPAASGYTTGFGVMAGVVAVAALAALLIPSARRQATAGPRGGRRRHPGDVRGCGDGGERRRGDGGQRTGRVREGR